MTRTMSIAAAALLCAGALPVARANCGAAPQPAFAIPDGAHASKDEMSAARDNLSEYSAQVAAYASCLDAEQADSGRSVGIDARRLRVRYLDLGSAALEQLASVVSCFTQQVEAFHATGGGTDAGPAQCSRGFVTPP
jgi:predicted outer membrane protein